MEDLAQVSRLFKLFSRGKHQSVEENINQQRKTSISRGKHQSVEENINQQRKTSVTGMRGNIEINTSVIIGQKIHCLQNINNTVNSVIFAPCYFLPFTQAKYFTPSLIHLDTFTFFIMFHIHIINHFSVQSYAEDADSSCVFSAVAPPGTVHHNEEQFLSKVFLWVAILFIVWLLIA